MTRVLVLYLVVGDSVEDIYVVFFILELTHYPGNAFLNVIITDIDNEKPSLMQQSTSKVAELNRCYLSIIEISSKDKFSDEYLLIALLLDVAVHEIHNAGT